MVDAPSLFLGFDVGTQGTKALLIDTSTQRVVARASQPASCIAGLPPGHQEQHPERWVEDVATTARAVLAGVDPSLVQALAVSGQQHGCVVLDADDQVVRPAKLWCDTSTVEQARALSLRLGRTVPTGFTASKLMWLAAREPANWQRVRSVLLPHDYVNFRLTGRKTMECGDASGTGWFDPATRQFDARAMQAIDAALPSMLPPLLGAGEPAGELSAAGAALLGLRAGTLVAAGGGDNMMSAIGAGATREGVVVMSLGTSGTVFTRTAAPLLDDEGLIAPFCSSDGAFLPLLCVMNLTGVLEEVIAAFGGDHASMTAAAATVAPGSGGLLWLPFLLGERVPDLPQATATLLGIRPGLLRPGPLYRAALEGTALSLAFGVDRMRDLGIDVAEVRLVGGGARNVLWRQILADVLAAAVTPLQEGESAALGAALQAVWTWRRAHGDDVGIDAVAAPWARPAAPPALPDPAHLDAVQQLRERHAAALSRLHDVRT